MTGMKATASWRAGQLPSSWSAASAYLHGGYGIQLLTAILLVPRVGPVRSSEALCARVNVPSLSPLYLHFWSFFTEAGWFGDDGYRKAPDPRVKIGGVTVNLPVIFEGFVIDLLKGDEEQKLEILISQLL
jgi:hypothetical protein